MRTVTTSVAERQPDNLQVNDRPADDGRSGVGRVLVVEEHTLIAAGLKVALTELRWEVETASGPSERDVIDHARKFRPHCVLLDVPVGYVSGNGFDLIRPLVAVGANVVLLTAERRRTILAECLEAGASGWIRPSACLDEVDATLALAMAGESILGRTEHSELLENLRVERTNALRLRARFDALTPREALVLGALANGRSAEEVARDHFVALTTVRSQIRAILQKLGVRSQLAAVAVADAHRWLLPADAQPDRERRRQPTVTAARERELSVRTA